jgi:hypothetical protein
MGSKRTGGGNGAADVRTMRLVTTALGARVTWLESQVEALGKTCPAQLQTHGAGRCAGDGSL